MGNKFKSKVCIITYSSILAITAAMTTPGQVIAAGVSAKVVALDQVIVYNRLGAFNPAGMIYALARDVFPIGTDPLLQTYANSCAAVTCSPGNVQLRDDKRPRPITLRVNEGDTLQIQFTNLLANYPVTHADNAAAGIGVPDDPSEQPATRSAGVHVHGMQLVNGIADDGSNVGSGSSLVGPGGSATYTLYAEKEGAYVMSSGPSLGGEGGSGAIANGLFGVVNVEPADAEWYRSQLTRQELEWATAKNTDGVSMMTVDGHPIINYNAVYPAGSPYAGMPILRMRNGGEIVHSDLNAVITGPNRGNFMGILDNPTYPNRNRPFRELTVVFHDEIKVVQAFPDWYEEELAFTLSSVKDGFAINYGTGGIGSEIIANRLGYGPMKDCTECKYEEFFLTSWAVGDPAMIVDVPATMARDFAGLGETNDDGTPLQATRAFYPDDPSNVFHGYLNDRTKIRNIHVGSEFHMFHLHAHQWLLTPEDDNSSYLDSQAIGPGSSFTYEIAYGGGGNRNKTPGDSILHCHFYPHFAQGMWGLWRVHDTFEPGSVINEDGTVLERGLPDGEIPGGGYADAGQTVIPGGTPIPAVTPLPGQAMPPMPGTLVAALTDESGDGIPETASNSDIVAFQGYPFYIPGVAGHRPPTPPVDLAKGGGIPRHVITGGTFNQTQSTTDFTKELLTAVGYELPESGTSEERAAMAFHGLDRYHSSWTPEGDSGWFEVNGLAPQPGAPFADPCRADNGYAIEQNRTYRASVIQLPEFEMNKAGWNFAQQRIIVLDSDVEATLSGDRAPEPFVMRANSGDCVEFYHTNRVPNIYEGDAFQVTTPTDVIGQHIHLVKFDVTSSDGSANGFNYEDGTFSPDEIAERIHAFQADGGSWEGAALANLEDGGELFRTTVQRWYVDPVKNIAGYDRTLGNVFTHDHFGPSTHQQIGLYAVLLTEPNGSTWHDPVTGMAYGGGSGGEVTNTSWRADIKLNKNNDAYREFYIEFADFQLAYWGGGGAAMPVNPPDRKEIGLPDILEANPLPLLRPEAVSAADPGTFVVNYRNEPIAMRVLDIESIGVDPKQQTGDQGDLSFAFSSLVRPDDDPTYWPYPGSTASIGARAGDPFTPILNVYPGDKVSIRTNVGAHEEGHVFSINGVKWLQEYNNPSSGLVGAQMMALSEYFRFEIPGLGKIRSDFGVDDYIYKVGSSVDALWNGAWGIMRAHEDQQPFLRDLPNNPTPWKTFKGKPPRDDQPDNGQIQHYTVVAVAAEDVLPEGTLHYNTDAQLHDPTALMYVLAEDLEPVTIGDPLCERPVDRGKKPKTVTDVTLATCKVQLKAEAPIEPLVLRASAGMFIDVDLYNKVLRQATDENESPVFNSDGRPVFQDPGPEVNLYLDPTSTTLAEGTITYDQVPDQEGFNTLPMIVEHFNANDIHPSAHVGLHAQLVGYDISESDGMNVGYNPIQTAAPGEKISYRWYAGDIKYNADGTKTYTPVEFGAVNLMPADPIKHSSKGLVGGLIVEPEGAQWTYDPGTRTTATVTYDNENGKQSFRDFVMIFQDDINMQFADGSPIPTVSDEEDSEDSGMKAVNYRTDPIWHRLGIGPTADPQVTRAFDFTDAFAGEPQTPVFTAKAGEKVRFRILKPGGHNRNHVFTLHGHLWARHPFAVTTLPDGRVLPVSIAEENPTTFYHGEQMGHGPANHFNILPLHGAGGANNVPGDYLYRDMVPVHVYNGIWGIFRVSDG